MADKSAKTVINLTVELPAESWKWAAVKRWIKGALRGYGIVVKDYREVPPAAAAAPPAEGPLTDRQQ